MTLEHCAPNFHTSVCRWLPAWAIAMTHAQEAETCMVDFHTPSKSPSILAHSIGM